MPRPLETRSRTLRGPAIRGAGKQVFGNFPPSVSSNVSKEWRGKQVTVSEGHHWPPPKGGGLTDRGGGFSTVRNSVEGKVSNLTIDTTMPDGWRYFYQGTVLPWYPVDGNDQPLWPPDLRSSSTQLDAQGAKAISRCKPTNSVADASTFLGELAKDGIPSLVGHQTWKDRSLSAKNAGSEYLNVQFGWQPLLNDIRKFSDATRNADKILAQYERDAGRVVRRKYVFPSVRETSEAVLSSTARAVTIGFSSGHWYYLPADGRVIRRRETLRNQWFSGAFTYHLPTGYDSRSELARIALLADKLYGVALTPETLWNISPWSWVVDWFSNTGDVISNLQDFATGGLVMPYGYMMERTITKDTYTIERPGFKNGNLKVAPLTLVTESKVRRQANPFGFGVSWSGLSSFQVSILAALGISRGR